MFPELKENSSIFFRFWSLYKNFHCNTPLPFLFLPQSKITVQTLRSCFWPARGQQGLAVAGECLLSGLVPTHSQSDFPWGVRADANSIREFSTLSSE